MFRILLSPLPAEHSQRSSVTCRRHRDSDSPLSLRECDEPASVCELLEVLGQAAGARSDSHALGPGSGSYLQLRAATLAVLTDEQVSVPVFLICARVLKAWSCERPIAEWALATEIRRVSSARSVITPRISRAIELLESAGRDALRLHEVDLGRRVNMDPTRLGREVRRETGVHFREWKWGIGLKLAVQALLTRDQSIKSAAYESGMVTQTGSTILMGRVTRRLLGITPSELQAWALEERRRRSVPGESPT